MLKIGDVCIVPPVALAPMEDVTSLAMRQIAKRIAGPGLMFTEFVSAMAVHFNPVRAIPKMRVEDDERPLGVQIYGGDPAIMAETARIAEECGADIVDINMGCWVPKVCRTGSGAALLKDPKLAVQIVDAVVRAVCRPVTVKVRAGWDYSLFAAPDLAKGFQDVGARAITLHARFAKQGFEGEADWNLIRDLRRSVTVPLFGNGDIKTPEDARRMMEVTGCDGVMVGRAAISNPWALRRICGAFNPALSTEDPMLGERVETALEHIRLTIRYQVEAEPGDDVSGAEARACRSLRGQIPLYIKAVHGASVIRARLTQCSSYAEFEDVLRTFERTTEANAFNRLSLRDGSSAHSPTAGGDGFPAQGASEEEPPQS